MDGTSYGCLLCRCGTLTYCLLRNCKIRQTARKRTRPYSVRTSQLIFRRKNSQLPQADDVEYLSMYLDRRFAWRKHITSAKNKIQGIPFWMLEENHKISHKTKVLVFKVILKSSWTYGIHLCGTASNYRRPIVCHQSNNTKGPDIQITSSKEKITSISGNIWTTLKNNQISQQDSFFIRHSKQDG